MSYHQVRVGLSLDEGDFNRIFEYFFSNFIFDIRREMGLKAREAERKSCKIAHEICCGHRKKGLWGPMAPALLGPAQSRS